MATDDKPRLVSAVPAKERPACREEFGNWAEAFRRGEPGAVERLIEESTPRVTALVRRLLAWPAEIDDVVHDVFVAALMARRSFRGQSTVDTWITRITINRCRAYNRRRWIRQRLTAIWRDERRELQESDATDKLAFAEQTEYVRRVVANLPQTYREVVVLYYLEERSAAEIASVLGVKVSAVEKRLSRARRKLAERLATRKSEMTW